MWSTNINSCKKANSGDGSIAMYLLGEGGFRKARAMEAPRPEGEHIQGEQKARHEDYM
ncbi:hypothetical protein YC2023_059775 [Brassica napus]